MRRLTRTTAVFALGLGIIVAGSRCSQIHLNPGEDVAPSRDTNREWTPPASVANSNEIASGRDELRALGLRTAEPAPPGDQYDLPAVIDVALRSNPQTKRAWYSAHAAAAQYGQSRSDNYPKVAGEAEAGYFKLPLQFPGQTLVIRNEEFLPQLRVNYDLLDFGRSRSKERGAREQLIAANFAFNRAIQDVVFEVEKSYYVLAAADASVRAAEANLKLAQTSLDAIEERHHVGLATKPQILLAKQVQAQAVYDLENARSMVHDAEAGMRRSIGLAPNAPVNIRADELDHLPGSLGQDIEILMSDALKQRPDIAAEVAAVRAGDAAIARARAEYYPEVEIGGNYGQVIWSYTVNGGSTQNLNQPFYGAFLTLRWNLFTGFERYYGVQKAIADRDAAREQLKSTELDAVTAVWTAYYDFHSAQKKYEASEVLVSASQEAYDANLESHRHGLSTITDLVNAERDLMGARYTLIQNKAGLMISSSALVHALGTTREPGAPIH
ncbi:MAG TPA: TolC family protein [Candidatus Binataceae bacterium]|nr:TolC family protein [Candidatus Binataceae bacterium]